MFVGGDVHKLWRDFYGTIDGRDPRQNFKSPPKDTQKCYKVPQFPTISNLCFALFCLT